MGPLERERARRQGMARIASMKRRAWMLRKRIVVGALVAFVLLWGVVFGQMISGHDPVLSRSAGGGSKAGGESAVPRVALVRSDEAAEEAGDEDEDGEASALETELRAEEEMAEAERVEAEQAEIEQIEAEEQELEPVTTGQS